MIGLYSTFAGARRAAQGRPILRVLHHPEHAFIVLPSMATQIMAIDVETGRADGVIPYMTLSGCPNVELELTKQQNRIDKLVEAGRMALDTGYVGDLDLLVFSAEAGCL